MIPIGCVNASGLLIHIKIGIHVRSCRICRSPVQFRHAYMHAEGACTYFSKLLLIHSHLMHDGRFDVFGGISSATNICFYSETIYQACLLVWILAMTHRLHQHQHSYLYLIILTIIKFIGVDAAAIAATSVGATTVKFGFCVFAGIYFLIV